MDQAIQSFSRNVFEALIRQNTSAILFLNEYGHIIDCNESASKLFGYSQKELSELEFHHLFSRKTVAALLEKFNSAKKGQSMYGSATASHKDDYTFQIDIQLEPNVENNRVKSVMLTATDKRSQQRLDELSLMEELELFRHMVELSPKGMVIHQHGIIKYANSSALKTLQEDELIGLDIFSFIHEDYRPLSAKRALEIEKGNKLDFVEMKMTLRNNKDIFVDIGGSPILFNGQNMRLAMFRDVTSRKVIEQNLRESEERYQKLVEMSPDPVMVLMAGKIKYINAAGVAAFGFKAYADMIGTTLFDYITEQDQYGLIDKVNRLLQEEEYTIELIEQTMLRRDGSSFVAEGKAMGIYFEDRPAIQIVFRDITIQKKLEQALKRSEEKYRLIAENMTDLVSIMDEDGVFSYLSPSYLQVLGYEPEALEGTSLFKLAHPDDLMSNMVSFSEMIDSSETKTVEYRHKHMYKGWIWVEAKGTPFYDEEKQDWRILVVTRDIEKRKQLQDKLNELAYYDELTGLAKRTLFIEQVNRSLKESKLIIRKLALIYMDLDKFKVVNDTFGHAAGDELLKQFAGRVQSCLRDSDVMARQSGDEFTILVSDIKDENVVENIVKRISQSLERPFQIGSHRLMITASLGVATFPRDGETYQELLHHADKEMYRQKENK